ncbi:MAG: glycosyltransferase, partial [Bacteroidales bacterium]|nr:glycosyltransferase [Bacteroidales bacterium]
MSEFFLNTSLPHKVLTSVFLITIFIQLAYYLLLFLRAGGKSPSINTRERKYPSVSVIICAKNEAENLQEKLLLFLEQNYPDFELIVVNDGSDDNTNEVLENLKLKYSHLRISTINKDSKFLRGKKLALTIGLKAAKNDIVLLTDADCIPASQDWIKYMIRNYDKNKSVILGLGLYKKRRGLLNNVIRFESAFIAMQYISLTRSGRPYMGVGRNLSYRKELFFNNKGFASHLKLESGDDDLFIHEVANSENCIVETNPSSFTYSEPETKWGDWIRQKK